MHLPYNITWFVILINAISPSLFLMAIEYLGGADKLHFSQELKAAPANE